MTTLIDYILDLFRSPQVAASFVTDPEGALRDAGVPSISAAQFASVAASAAPAGLALGGGDPIHGLQRAVADYHGIAAPFSPQTTFAPSTDFASHNATEVASNNDFMSPDQAAGANAQNGAFNLGFGDFTFGDKTTNTASDGGVVVGGDSHGTVTAGNGNVVGDGNSANTGIIEAGSHSAVTVGAGNDTAVHDGSQHAGGDLITGNEGAVIKDNDMSGGHGGSAGASGGGSLIGIGTGGNEANAGNGGSGGSIIVTDSHSASNSGNSATTVGGDQTTAGHDVSSTLASSVSSSTNASTNVHSQDTYSSDDSVHTTSSVHEDSSIHSDNSFTQENSLHQSADTHVDSDAHLGF